MVFFLRQGTFGPKVMEIRRMPTISFIKVMISEYYPLWQVMHGFGQSNIDHIEMLNLFFNFYSKSHC